MTPNKRILIVAAHPDDEILGCGGTILREMLQGCVVYSMILGEGITSRYEKREIANKNELEKLHRDIGNVAQFMSFKKHWLFNYPDNRFDTVPLLEIVKTIEKVKDEVKPDVIFTHFQNDLNIDHRITFQAVITATRPLQKESVKEILSFEIPSSTEWTFDQNFNPNVFVNVENTFEKKIQALIFYESEIRAYPHPRSAEALKIRAQYWGIVSGLKLVEPFILIRKIV